MNSIDNQSLPETVEAAIAAGVNAVKAIREARGYSVEDLAVTCGLATSEITGIENGEDTDPGKLRRIAAALGMPATAFPGS